MSAAFCASAANIPPDVTSLVLFAVGVVSMDGMSVTSDIVWV
jgi:hypothetical protein